MADCTAQHPGLKGFAVAAGVALVLLGMVPPEAWSKARASRHFLSWESRARPEEVRRHANRAKSLRRYRVGRDRVAKLKKSAFWNKRPYQFSSPVIHGGTLFVGVDAGRLYAFDVPGGKRRWEFSTEGPVQGKAAVADGTVYVGDSKAFVYALDAATGGEKWRARLGTEILAQPLIVGARLYVADLSGRLYALDASTGMEFWHSEPIDRSVGFSVRRASSPVEAEGLILMGTAAGSLVARRAHDGSAAWVRQIGDRQAQVFDVDSAPLLAGGRVYASSADGTLAALDLHSGEILWTADAGGVDDLLLSDGRLFASGSGVLSAIDSTSGDILWQQDLQTPEISSPVAGDHYVAVVSTKDKLCLVDRETGDIVYDRFVRRGSFGDPAVDGDRLYLLSNSSRLYAFHIRELPPRKQQKR